MEKDLKVMNKAEKGRTHFVLDGILSTAIYEKIILL